MSLIGANGSVTSFPCNGEKICVGCDFWKGNRKISYNGTGVTSYNGTSAFCTMKKNETYPNQPCTCTTISFKKWEYLK